MQPNDIPTPDVPLSGGPMPLNQPFPKELGSAPLVDIAEQVGQAALENSVKKDDAKPQPEASESKEPEQQKPAGFPKENIEEKDEDKNSGSKGILELIKSPSKLSDFEKKNLKKATSNPVVKTIVIIGVLLLVIGLIVMFFVTVSLGIIMMLIGAVAVIASVLLPIGAKK